MRATAIIATILYIGLNFANVDALIPQYNIYKYKQDTSKGIDVSMFYDLSSSMLPYAKALVNDPQFIKAADYKDKIVILNDLLTARNNELKKSNWQSFSLAGYDGANIKSEK